MKPIILGITSGLLGAALTTGVAYYFRPQQPQEPKRHMVRGVYGIPYDASDPAAVLAKAAEACAHHRYVIPPDPTKPMPTWKPGFEQCEGVMKQFIAQSEARRIKEEGEAKAAIARALQPHP